MKESYPAKVGILHVHTRFSRDGNMGLADLREYCSSSGMEFACITDHAEDISQQKMQALVQACQSVSDGRFVAVPGLEFALDEGAHLLALELTSLPVYRSTSELLWELRMLGALTIIAHPLATSGIVGGDMWGMIDGVEAWNGSHDGGYFPNPAALRFFNDALADHPHIIAYGGGDLHSSAQTARVRTVVPSDRSVMCSLRCGSFQIHGSGWRIGSCPGGSLAEQMATAVTHRSYALARSARDLIKACIRRHGVQR